MRWILLSAALLVVGAACATGPRDKSGWPAVVAYELERQEDALAFAFSDAGAWTWRDGALELTGPSEYEPPQRSPRSIALIAEWVVGDFVLEADLLQTGREYGHRDLCLFFGFQSPERFYYAHLASAPDANAHNVFLVDGAPRTNLAPVFEQGVEWGDGVWHRVRLERSGPDVRVYFEGQEVLHASDATLTEGRVGLGSFDDTGRFRRVRLFSPDARRIISADPWGPFSTSRP